MLVVVKGAVKHNGEVFIRGEILPKMPRTEELRLLDLGVCIEGGEPIKATPQSQEQVPPVPPGAGDQNPPNDLNLDFNPEDTIQGKK